MMTNDAKINKVTDYGWKASAFNQSLPESSHIIYIRDFRYKHQQVITIPQKEFFNIKLEEDIPADECVNFITQVMKRISKEQRLNDVERKTIVPIIVHYVRSKPGFEQWRTHASQGSRLHMIINIYFDGKTNANAARLRPFVVMPTSLMLTTAELQDCTASVYSTDKQKHPEWFR